MAAFLKVVTVGQWAKFQKNSTDVSGFITIYIRPVSFVLDVFCPLDRTPSGLASRHSELADREGWQPITVSQDRYATDRAAF